MGMRQDNRLHWTLLAIALVSSIAVTIFLSLPPASSDNQSSTGNSPPEKGTPSDTPTTPLDRGVAFLMSQQSDDGLWRSEYYGNLKQGAAITAFVLSCMPDATNKLALQSAVTALLPEIRKNGYVTNADGPDYSNYGSAMLLLADNRLELELPDAVKQQLDDYLVRSQLNSEEEFQESNVDYGGWDLSGWMTGARRTTGSNTSVSASVLQTLALFRDQPKVAEAIETAQLWATRVQNKNGDGGFYFHPKRDHDGNKAGWADDNQRNDTRSYGSATADGLRILQALNKSAYDPAVVAAVAWLSGKTTGESDLGQVPGFSHEAGEHSWSHGLRYYYFQSLSHSLHLFPTEDGQRIARSIIDIVTTQQRQDGSWANSNARMREDDPIIATGFAITALRNCQQFLNE